MRSIFLTMNFSYEFDEASFQARIIIPIFKEAFFLQLHTCSQEFYRSVLLHKYFDILK